MIENEIKNCFTCPYNLGEDGCYWEPKCILDENIEMSLIKKIKVLEEK